MGQTELPFISKGSSGYQMFDAALKKLYQVDNITIDLSFKARRQDGLGLLMEAKGMRALDHTGSVWISRPVALLQMERFQHCRGRERDCGFAREP